MRVRNATPAARAAVSRVCAAADCPCCARPAAAVADVCRGRLKGLVVLLCCGIKSLLAAASAATRAALGGLLASSLCGSSLFPAVPHSIMSSPRVLSSHRVLPVSPLACGGPTALLCCARALCARSVRFERSGRILLWLRHASFGSPAPIVHCSASRLSCLFTGLLQPAVAAVLGQAPALPTPFITRCPCG